jgi:hypothetical protein
MLAEAARMLPIMLMCREPKAPTPKQQAAAAAAAAAAEAQDAAPQVTAAEEAAEAAPKAAAKPKPKRKTASDEPPGWHTPLGPIPAEDMTVRDAGRVCQFH